MTTYGEAVQMGLGANLAASIQNEVYCAGDALVSALIDPVTSLPHSNIPLELVSVLSHVMKHLSVVREVTDHIIEHYDSTIKEFDEANPGKLAAVSQELADMELIAQLQKIIGMTDEERIARHTANMEALAELGDLK